MEHVPAAAHPTRATWNRAVLLRMAGPGGLYNLGNVIGLSSGVAFAVLGAQAVGAGDGWAAAVVRHLAGSPGAIALSLAMIVFFVSGEMYHRAYEAMRVDLGTRFLRRGDWLSGLAALLLAVALVCFGDIWIALTSTVLLAGGKFGNAFLQPEVGQVRIEYLSRAGTTRARIIDVFRLAVVVSRIPAMAGLLLALIRSWPEPTLLQDAPTAILLGCYVLWLRADLLLARS